MSLNLLVTERQIGRVESNFPSQLNLSFLPISSSLVKYIVTTGNGVTSFGRKKVVSKEKTIEKYSMTVCKK